MSALHSVKTMGSEVRPGFLCASSATHHVAVEETDATFSVGWWLESI